MVGKKPLKSSCCTAVMATAESETLWQARLTLLLLSAAWVCTDLFLFWLPSLKGWRAAKISHWSLATCSHWKTFWALSYSYPLHFLANRDRKKDKRERKKNVLLILTHRRGLLFCLGNMAGRFQTHSEAPNGILNLCHNFSNSTFAFAR